MLIAALTVTALSAAETPPAPPLVAAAPNPGNWTITIKQKQPAPRTPADARQAKLAMLKGANRQRMVAQTVEQAGKDWHWETTYEDGKKDTYWIYHGIAVMFQSRYFDQDKMIMDSAGAHTAPEKPDRTDFPDVAWIDANHFTGSVPHAGRKCHVYARPAGAGHGKAVAYIDAQTRLPVTVETDDTLKTYTFNQASDTITPQGIFARRYLQLVNSGEQ
jgi:hypothetical protein